MVGTWRNETNDELNKLIINKKIINCFKFHSSRCFARVHRMQVTGWSENYMSAKPISERLAGRPKK